MSKKEKIKILVEGSVIKHKKFDEGKTELTIDSTKTVGDKVTYYCIATGKPGIVSVPADGDVVTVTDASAVVEDEDLDEDEDDKEEKKEAPKGNQHQGNKNNQGNRNQV